MKRRLKQSPKFTYDFLLMGRNSPPELGTTILVISMMGILRCSFVEFVQLLPRVFWGIGYDCALARARRRSGVRHQLDLARRRGRGPGAIR